MNLQTAILVACEAHKDQIDKASDPYILHPLRIMFQFDDEQLKIIAVLHDVVEDSQITLDDLRSRGFSYDIVDALDCLTKRSSESYEQFINRVSTNKLAIKVKIADLKDNLKLERLPTLYESDLKRIKKYHKALKVLQAKYC